ncbi:unnamed protein product [Phaedon cochleariae]|uniref:Cilia- and flagella-associated protein 251 n=1 Tax=Phaedon cochleariae TaxID=80249 RepID=A0A9P0GN89_PHACE|nr:unnamed protein product [Phaedon cochleariae]
MSDESISHKEDKENLLYIARKINLEEFSYGDDHGYVRESILSTSTIFSTTKTASDVALAAQKTELGPKLFKNPEVVEKTRPFDLQWSFGINARVKVRNMTTATRREIFFASSHFPILYDYCSRTMTHLEGHHQIISDISVSQTGRWIITSDDDLDGFLHVWDSEKDLSKSGPVRSFHGIYPHSGIITVRISGSAKFFVTIGSHNNEEYSVDFWLWTLGNDKPDDSYIVPKSYGTPVCVRTNPDIEEHIMVIFSKRVVFLIWDNETNKFVNPVTPQLLHANKLGQFTDGTYMKKCHECYVSSNNGFLSVFGNTLYSRPFEEGELDNTKIFQTGVKISPVSILACTANDGHLVIGDQRGYILFFDKRVRLLYWLCDFKLGPVKSITFNLGPKFTYQDGNKYFMPKTDDRGLPCELVDMIEEMEMLFRKDLPKDATLKMAPFIVPDFVVGTTDGNVYAVDCINNTCTPIFYIADDVVCAITTHRELNYIVIAYGSGRISLMDYETYELIRATVLPPASNEDGDPAVITCIKYSPQAFHLVCGRSNGEIWILEPILMDPKLSTPFRITKHKVVKIEFSHKPMQFAYFDDNRAVVIFSYNLETSSWEFQGKIRPHYEDINDLMFIPGNVNSKLYTISKDRHLVEYNNDNLEKEEFGIENRDRIEQSAIPMSFTYWVTTVADKQLGYMLFADNKHKLKFLYQSSKVPKSLVLAPAFGCFKNQLIRKMMIIPQCESKYMIFSTGKHFGIHILPPDGNPYKYVGYLAHPTGLQDFDISFDGRYIFTFGLDDRCVLKWKINTKAVEIMRVLGGKELEPYYCLIEGGYNGWLFREIKDLFYYMQILQQENIDLPRRVSDSISITEIPDLFRTCGFYPSEFELENIMIDVRFRNMDESQKINEEVNFIDFVKLFCNHKPVYGLSKERLEEAFDIIVDCADEYNPSGVIDTEELIELLKTMGETMSHSNLFKCFKTLMRVENAEENRLDFLPKKMTFNLLFEDILGIDMERSQVFGSESDEIGIADEDIDFDDEY